ncbi:MAG TPA: methylated-DNA--[protein]-cysteine S-methyltransferase [Pseudolabrys sp.]|nr:methylated-DNA--[protein]-cysteine S-methyltransferase [Pseudolabrys sp.]
MTVQHFAVFNTALGACGIIWSARGIAGVKLPDADEAATRTRIARRHPGAQEADPPRHVQRAIDGIVALLDGEPHDFGDVALDFGNAPDFNRKVYNIALTIPPGRTMTYGEIAERLGDKLLARDVGTALGQNPIPIIMPCHRVLAAGGKTGGFSGVGGVVTKLRLLSIEGAQPSGPTLFDRLPLQARRR